MTRTRESGVPTEFLDLDGMIVRSAILFLDAIHLDEVRTVSREPIDWTAWRHAPA